jgi:thiol-disulfide isomerase/thioredoxin
MCFLVCLPNSFGQETPEPKPDTEKSTSTEDEDDPFAVPKEASVKELFTWIGKIKRTPQPRTAAEAVKTANRLFPAIIQACDLILQKTEDGEDVKNALKEKFSAYGVLVRYKPSAKEELVELAAKYASDTRPEIASMAVGFQLVQKSREIMEASAEDVQKFAESTLGFVERFGATRETISTASQIANTLGYSEHTEIAAGFHESLSKLVAKSDDESLRARSTKLLGAARRIRLPGNEMQLTGITANGESFDWSAYRGKVVLVDYWASWCGPCLAELPNMKKNLERYGEKGFVIVGINMDSTREAFEKCVEDKEISWVNIVSDEEGKKGWDVPNASYYGISAIPTAILVDQKGKVVSLRARGKELDQQLESLLGAE